MSVGVYVYICVCVCVYVSVGMRERCSHYEIVWVSAGAHNRVGR